MDNFCELIELTESDLYEVAGGSRHRSGNSIKVDVDIDVTSKPRTHIDNTVDNSVNILNFG